MKTNMSLHKNHALSSLLKSSVAVACSIVIVGTAHANPLRTSKPFDITVGVDQGASSVTYSNTADQLSGGFVTSVLGVSTVEELKKRVTTQQLTAVNSLYNSSAGAIVRIGYLGFPVLLQTASTSPAVTLNIPALNITQTFSGSPTDRDTNVTALFDYLKDNGSDIMSRLQQKLVQVSPISPLAGNPSSLQSRMVTDDFDRGFTAFASNIKSAEGDSTASNSDLLGVGLSMQSMDTGNVKTETITLPLSYTVRNDLDPRRQWTFYAPITQSDTGGAKGYGLNLGVAYRLPINDEWSIMPGVGYGVTGSIDLGTAAAMMAASVTSQYTLKLDNYDLAFGNMIGLSQSDKLTVGDYSVDPKISNTVFRNGVLLSRPTMIGGRKLAVEASFILTNYTGSALYSNQYQEVGLTIGTNKGANTARSYLRAGVSYLTGENGISATRLNFGYWF